MIKATTEHGTYYLIDQENFRAKRVKGKDRNDIYGTDDWFHYVFAAPFNWDTHMIEDNDLTIGKGIYFKVSGVYFNMPEYIISTDVVSIEEYHD